MQHAYPVPANSNGAYGHPSSNTPYGVPQQQPYRASGQNYPPAAPSASSGAGAIKWLVVGCLGCSGLLVLGFIALVLIAALGSGGSESGGSGGGGTPTQDPSAVATEASDGGGETADPTIDADDTPTEEPTDTTAGVIPSGMHGETDEAKITVISTERTQRLSDSLWEYETNNEFFVVNLEYTNKSGESHDVWANDFTLVGTDGNEYSSNTDVSLALEDPFIIEEVNPGLTITGTLVFEVPPGTEFSELTLTESIGTSSTLTVSFA